MAHSEEFESWKEEKQSAFLYRVLAKYEGANRFGTLFEKLAQAAERQAETWEKKIRSHAQGDQVPEFVYHPTVRVRLVAAMVRAFGPRSLRQILTALKLRGLSVYVSVGHEHEDTSSGRPEKLHRSITASGNLRAAVFGVNDGLVSNFCLIMGVSGAAMDSRAVVLTGTAGMIAGALSMAAGEYVSVRSQRELFEYQMALEAAELEQYPEEEAHELALIYEAKGLDPDDARRITSQIVKNPEKALDTLAREELGLNPDELGSPTRAAISSFLCFGAGALVPLVPFTVGGGLKALTASAVMSSLSLFSVGATISLFTGRSAIWSGLRMLLIGAVSGAVTYWIGSYFG